jgi:hypothetical protein
MIKVGKRIDKAQWVHEISTTLEYAIPDMIYHYLLTEIEIPLEFMLNHSLVQVVEEGPKIPLFIIAPKPYLI